MCRSIALAALCVPAAALAADHADGVRFDVHGDAGGYGSVGAGFRVDVPLFDGVLDRTDDTFALSPGADLYFQSFYTGYYAGGPYVIPSLVVQWNLWVAPEWSIFPEAGLALFVGDANLLPRGHAVYAAPDLGFGVRYHFSDRNALLARVSTPTGLQLGVTF